MFERLKRLYNENLITEKELANAIIKGWITEEEKQMIISEVEINQQVNL